MCSASCIMNRPRLYLICLKMLSRPVWNAESPSIELSLDFYYKCSRLGDKNEFSRKWGGDAIDRRGLAVVVRSPLAGLRTFLTLF